MPEAVRYCKRKGIGVLTLGVDCDPMNMTALQEEYREHISFVTDIDEIPETLRRLLASRRHDRPPSTTRRVQ